MKFYISGYIFDNWLSSYLSYSLEVNKPSSLELYFDSNGGDPVAAGALAEVIRAYNGEVSAYAIGYLASAAIIPFLAVPAERRWIAKTSSVLLHRMRTNAYRLTAEELAVASEEAVKYEAQLVELHAKALGKTASEMAEIMKAERLLTAQEAVDLGLAIGFVGESTEPAIMAGKTLCAAGGELVPPGDDGCAGDEPKDMEPESEQKQEQDAGEKTDHPMVVEDKRVSQRIMMLAKYAEDETIRDYSDGKISDVDFVLSVAKSVGEKCSFVNEVPVATHEVDGAAIEPDEFSKYVSEYNSDPTIRILYRHGAKKYAECMMSMKARKNGR